MKRITSLSYIWQSLLYVLVIIFSYFIGIRYILFFGIFELSKVNPCLEYSGLAIARKSEINKQINDKRMLKYTLFSPNNKEDSITKSCKFASKYGYRVIAKPNRGFSGFGIVKINNEKELRDFLSELEYEYIIQEYCNLENEYGIFIERDIDSKVIKITAISKKINNAQLISKKYFDYRELKYTDNKNLECAIQEILRDKNIYHARFDVFAKDDKNLMNANFKIIELNGSMSEPIHIYDPKYSVIDIAKEFYNSYNKAFRIAKFNSKTIDYNLANIIKEFYKLIFIERVRIIKYVEKQKGIN